MTSAPQKFLNAKYYETILTKSFGEQIEVKDFSIEGQVANGSYCSKIFKAKLLYRKQNDLLWQELHLFVKELFESLSSISTEHLLYSKIIPGFNQVLANANIKEQLTPRVYAAEKSSNELHVFEDLTQRGYDVSDRLLGYDLHQAKAVLRKLAIFHAASFVYSRANSDIAHSLKGFYYNLDASMMDFVDSKVEANAKFVAPIVAEWPGYAEISKKILKNTGETFRRKFLQVLDKDAAAVRIILHGDVWIRNLMMRRDDNTKEWDVIFLDFQNIYNGCPVFDIVNMFLTSVQLDVLQFKRDELISYYHEILASTLTNLGRIELIPTLELLQQEFRRVEFFNYYVLLFPFAQTNLSEELADGASFDDFSNEEAQLRNRKDIYSNPRVIATYKYMLKHFDDLGILD